MHKTAYLIALFLILSVPSWAMLEPSYNHHEPRVATSWYGPSSPAQRQTDLKFIDGMRLHHQGALSMSEDYLKDTAATNSQLQQLARGIIHNQDFEIGILTRVETLLKNKKDGQKWQQIAAKGVAQEQKFFRAPMPGPLDSWTGSSDTSTRDVQFAKGMIIHHEAALDMSQDYLNDPNGDNGYLELLCLDIIRDQKQEISFLQSIIDTHPNADAITIDPSMIHGMPETSTTGSSHHH